MADTREEFIKKVYSQTYQMAQENGIPHDFIMAQVIQETGWGKHVLKDTNNIFNIKTGKSWKGKKSTHNVWEIINGKKVWVDADFRKYDSYGDSVDDWLKFLKKNKRYKALFEKENLSTDDFARRIQKAGYATDPNYAKNIVAITKGKTYKSLIGKAKKSYQNNMLKSNSLKEQTITKNDDKKAIKKEENSKAPSSNTWDKYTNQRIQKIHPLIRNNATQFINSVQKKLDIKLRVTTGMRTIKEQNNLYKKGRTEKGSKVTWVKGGHSYHNYGLAIDVVEIKNKKTNWNTKWKDIAKIAKDKGFEWGGDWKDVSDKPHFQKSFGYTTKQLKKRFESGKIKNGFVDIKGWDTTSSEVDIKVKEAVIADRSNAYNVKRGDNLSKISKKYNMSLNELLILNPQIKDRNRISIGQKVYTSKSAPTINVNLENKSQKLFKKLGLRHEKIPTLNHNKNLPEKVEGMYKKDNLSLKKNPRVSDKQAEAVAMHEIYHHTQKDKGLELGQEEAQANRIEKVYLNENQESSEEIDFDLIYAYTIKQFYEHEELEQLVCILGGDTSSVRKIYSNAMYAIGEFQQKENSNNIEYGKNQLKKVVGDSGIRYKQNGSKFKVSDEYSTIKNNLTRGLTDWAVTDKEATQTYTILDKLNEKDYVDTTSKMKKDDVWDTYLGNINNRQKDKVLEKITQVDDVLKDKDWVAYGSKIYNPRTTVFGKNIPNYFGSDVAGECADYSRTQIEQGGDYTAMGAKDRVDMFYTRKQDDESKKDCDEGFKILHKNLNEGKAVMTGVGYKDTDTGNPNKSTNHYVTTVGMGHDDEGKYYSYYDNYTGEKGVSSLEDVGKDTKLNRFRPSKEDACKLVDDDGTLPYNQNNPNDTSPKTYTVTEVRDNEDD